MRETKEKLNNLLELLRSLESVAVGFSGGVDSTFLAAAASRVLGEKAVAVTAYSETLPDSERKEAIEIAEHLGIRHVLMPISELNSPEFVANTSKRCYYCKKVRFTELVEWAKSQGLKWVLEGSNADDLSDYRPGMQAVREIEGVCSPLLEVGLTKREIREISQEWAIPTWNKLSAACLSSRVAYGLEVTPKRLNQIEKAEEFLKKHFSGQIRVRHHGDLARIEVSPEDINILLQADIRKAVAEHLTQLGFAFVTLDLLGYRTGSLNATLERDK